MRSTLPWKALIAAIGIASVTAVTAATTRSIRTEDLGAVPTRSLSVRFGLGANGALVERSAVAVPNGRYVVRHQQFYRGVPVYGRSIAVVEDANGRALRASGELAQNLDSDLVSVAPKLTGPEALGALRSHMRTFVAGATSVSNEQADLFVYPQDGAPARLVYRTSYFLQDNDQDSRPTAIIDANTGEVIRSWDGLTHASALDWEGNYRATGPGGNQKTGRYHYGTDRPKLLVTKGLICRLRNPFVVTHDLHHRTRGGLVVKFICPDSNTDAINGAYSPANDAHYFGGVVHDMYVAYTGAAPVNGKLHLYVHYRSNYENAFWNGGVVYFGDGGSKFYPLVSLDVASHEISHGYTEQNSDLEYRGQPGAINEAYSDIAGEAAEFYDRGAADFLVAADVERYGALRDICDPPQDGRSIDNAADYHGGLSVHHSSGVYNRAFCVLAKSSGWDVKKAFKAFALANKSYWTAMSDFNAGACGVESAATDLGYDASDVVSAFKGVGVTCTGSDGGGGSTELQNGVALTNQSGSTGIELNYTVVVPADAANLVIASSGSSGNADLYTKFGSAPTTSSYDCRSSISGNNETCAVASPQAGTYYVKLRGYSSFSGVTIKASWSTGGGGNVLQNGVPVTGLSGAKNAKLYYAVVVPSGATNLATTTSGGSGDEDLYVKFGSTPTTSSYDCRSNVSVNTESCTIPSPTPGTHHIMLDGYSAFSGVTLKASWNE
jgi:pseudolysin/vibriolysin